MRKLLGLFLLLLSVPAYAQVAVPYSSANPVTINYAIAPANSSAVEGSHVIKSSAGTLYGVSVTTGATAGFLMIFNATSAPSDGSVTPAACYELQANQTTAVNFTPPAAYSTGITAVFSSTGCTTKTVSATAYFSWQSQ